MKIFNESVGSPQARFLYSLYFFTIMCYTNTNIVIYSVISLLGVRL